MEPKNKSLKAMSEEEKVNYANMAKSHTLRARQLLEEDRLHCAMRELKEAQRYLCMLQNNPSPSSRM
ncbi:hypothetical protein LR48_Vigan10g258700 [Vigna angularis]|uniref:Uncharacterized protein n=2 Tax=Phaseolus angularis TaxID=3914 RepID=A0A0L9VNR2_PHAAN|nr:hypothetical protein LR48_Vigan10g258700 [Vigna angularis]